MESTAFTMVHGTITCGHTKGVHIVEGKFCEVVQLDEVGVAEDITFIFLFGLEGV
jgi:hypothetical protein